MKLNVAIAQVLDRRLKLSGSNATDYGSNGSQHDCNVEEEVLVLDVEEVEFQVLVNWHGAGRADLPQAGDARDRIQPESLTSVHTLPR